MPRIASWEEVKSQRRERQVATGTAWRTDFIAPDPDNPETPQAFLVEGTPGRVIRTHYHDHDQYQVIVHGGGVLGRHELSINAVHFSRKHTPYGPVVFGDPGLGFLTLRAVKDGGAQYMDEPEKKEKLAAVANRQPWQATEAPVFDAGVDGVTLHTFSEIRSDDGLASYSISVAPGARALAPDPKSGGGQYVIVTRGSLLYGGREYGALSVAFVFPRDGSFELQAGNEGVDALVLQFPRSGEAAAGASAGATGQVPGTRKWQCMLCAFEYDEAKGLPQDGIPPGTPWEDVPEDWVCPDCCTSKGDFQMRVVS